MQRRAMMIRIASGFIVVGWEVGWGIMKCLVTSEAKVGNSLTKR